MIWLTGLLLLDYCLKVFCQCNGTVLTLTASEIPASFSSPSPYSNNENCQWLIDSGVDGQPIILYGDDMSLDCSANDFIQIIDGPSELYGVLATNLCSTSATVEYVSTQRYVTITFAADASVLATGFTITYLSAADTSGTGCSTENSLTATTTPQYLSSESFPAKYSSSSSCRWLITAPTATSTLDITVVWSDIEDGVNCAYDKLIVYDGTYVCENQVLLTDCTARTHVTDTPTVYTSSGNGALVMFTSDSSLDKYGFIIQYTENIITTTTTISTTTTTAVNATTAVGKAAVEVEKVLDFPLMAACAVGGAGFVLILMAMIHLIKYLKTKKPRKKSLAKVQTKVQTIAPLPARTVFDRRQHPHRLSFV